MIRHRLMQIAPQLPRSRRSEQGEYTEEHPGKLQPQNARKLHKGTPHGLAEPLASPRQALFGLSSLSRRAGRLLPQSNPGSCRSTLRRSRVMRSIRLDPSRRARRRGRVHRCHQRLRRRTGSHTKRTTEAHRIHTRKCSRSSSPAKVLHLNQRPCTLLHPNSKSAVTGKGGQVIMKNIFWMVGGLCAAAVGFLVMGRNRTQPVEVLAHRLEEAWADHHTVV